MTFKEHILIIHFLSLLKERTEAERLEPLTKAFLYILPRTTLLAIIDQMTGKGRHPDDPNFSTLSNEALLNWIDDQYYVLDYLLENLKNNIKL